MFIVSQKVTVAIGSESDFVSAINNRTEIKEQEGFIDLTIARSTDDESTFLVIGRWESEEAHDAWENTQARAEAKRNNKAEIIETDTGTYEVLGTV